VGTRIEKRLAPQLQHNEREELVSVVSTLRGVIGNQLADSRPAKQASIPDLFFGQEL
jgi:hypothetical protein